MANRLRLLAPDAQALRQIQTGKRPPSDDPVWQRLADHGLVYLEESKNRAGVVELRIWMLTPAGARYVTG
jgi:hypothetical protein